MVDVLLRPLLLLSARSPFALLAPPCHISSGPGSAFPRINCYARPHTAFPSNGKYLA
ncbi:hypothetical protein AURDEDRAFT_117451 [Auricularia subglabra TFB-10046 SS5]|uniref:Uncharacterized protein n=1 Tax=Auricularia subglabra (strain TFB-10046 / SS5) TaxID=717982 RepID=J0WR33_AURST|nr:hypothetical protein AURDEDRAFT_117451 [Auricularia subglabra TFB-10046 SS5]